MAFKDARRCTATAKRTGERCKNVAVTGYNVCRFHGAGSPGKGRPGGIQKTLKANGRYSKFLPIRLAARYQEARNDPARLHLQDEIALIDTRLTDILFNLQDGDTRKLWQDLSKTWTEFEKATASNDKDKQRNTIYELGRIIKRGNAIYASWSEVYNVAEQRRRLVESERKRMVEMQQMITAERAMLLLGAILGVIRQHVDDPTVINAISTEFRKLAVIDAGG